MRGGEREGGRRADRERREGAGGGGKRDPRSSSICVFVLVGPLSSESLPPCGLDNLPRPPPLPPERPTFSELASPCDRLRVHECVVSVCIFVCTRVCIRVYARVFVCVRSVRENLNSKTGICLEMLCERAVDIPSGATASFLFFA